MKNPKISIITVCYNSEKYIEQCILSVLDQDYPDVEYIIIDGGSSDGTLDIINRYKDRLACVVSEPDRGISDAFNKGIARATGDIIGIINSDDYMMPGVLSKVADEYDDGTDVIRGYCLLKDESTGLSKTLRPNNKFALPPIGAIICHESSFIRRDVYERLGGYKVHLRYAMDLDLFIRMHKAGVKHKFVDVCIDTFRVGGASSTMSKRMFDERKVIMDENGANMLQTSIYMLYHWSKYLLKRLLK